MVTVIERDGDLRQAEHIQMPGKDGVRGGGGGGGRGCSKLQTLANIPRMQTYSVNGPRINTRILLNHSLEDVRPGKQLKLHLSPMLGDNELGQLRRRAAEEEQVLDVKKMVIWRQEVTTMTKEV